MTVETETWAANGHTAMQTPVLWGPIDRGLHDASTSPKGLAEEWEGGWMNLRPAGRANSPG